MFGGDMQGKFPAFDQFNNLLKSGPLGSYFGGGEKPKPTAVTAPTPMPESKDTPGRHKSLLGA